MFAQGYHAERGEKVPKGNEPESIYAVMSGTHSNATCCFDYGNSENTRTARYPQDYHAGSMEAIYFGSGQWLGRNKGSGSGPWVGADMEGGYYYGGGNATRVNQASKPLPHEFASLSLKGRSDGFTLRGGDATQGPLETMYDGPRPDCRLAGTCTSNTSYQPMTKQGAIILGAGGDFSYPHAIGTFYEGFLAVGSVPDATDAAIQSNIVAVGYKTLKADDDQATLGSLPNTPECLGDVVRPMPRRPPHPLSAEPWVVR